MTSQDPFIIFQVKNIKQFVTSLPSLCDQIQTAISL